MLVGSVFDSLPGVFCSFRVVLVAATCLYDLYDLYYGGCRGWWSAHDQNSSFLAVWVVGLCS